MLLLGLLLLFPGHSSGLHAHCSGLPVLRCLWLSLLLVVADRALQLGPLVASTTGGVSCCCCTVLVHWCCCALPLVPTFAMPTDGWGPRLLQQSEPG